MQLVLIIVSYLLILIWCWHATSKERKSNEIVKKLVKDSSKNLDSILKNIEAVHCEDLDSENLHALSQIEMEVKSILRKFSKPSLKTGPVEQESRLKKISKNGEEQGSEYNLSQKADIESLEDKKPKVLIVDDMQVNVRMLEHLLKDEASEIASITSGEEAIKELSKPHKYDIILLDVMMPKVNGYDVLAKIREDKKPTELPVLLVTAQDQPEDVAKGLSLGANDYIAKPFSKAELVARIKNHYQLKLYYSLVERYQSVLKEKVEDRSLKLKDSLYRLHETQIYLAKQSKDLVSAKRAAKIVALIESLLLEVFGTTEKLVESVKPILSDSDDTQFKVLQTIIKSTEEIQANCLDAHSQLMGALSRLSVESEDKEQVTLSDMLENCIDIASKSAKKKWGLEVEVERDFEESPHQLTCYPKQLASSILLLFDEAFKSIEKKRAISGNSYNAKLSVDFSILNKEFRISIADNGAGCESSEIASQIENSSPGKDISGYLTLQHLDYVKKVMELHNGSHTTSSQKGVSLENTLTIPK